jgi:hypothetical protein
MKKVKKIDFCEQLLFEHTCRNSDGSMCNYYPCTFLKMFRGEKNEREDCC